MMNELEIDDSNVPHSAARFVSLLECNIIFILQRNFDLLDTMVCGASF